MRHLEHHGCAGKRKLLARPHLQEVRRGSLGHSSGDCKRALLRLVSLCCFTWKSLYKASLCCRLWYCTQQELYFSICAKLNLCISTWQRILCRRDSRTLICLHSARLFLLGVSGHLKTCFCGVKGAARVGTVGSYKSASWGLKSQFWSANFTPAEIVLHYVHCHTNISVKKSRQQWKVWSTATIGCIESSLLIPTLYLYLWILSAWK